MSNCGSCPSHGSCKSSTTNGGNGNCEHALSEQDKIINSTLGKIKNKLFVMSGKGGVGKSSVTVNLAVALAKNNFKVGILDVDIHGPSIPNLLGLNSQLKVDDNTGQILPAEYNENLFVLSMDSLLQDRDQAILWRGPMKTQAIRQFLTDVNWGALDFLLIDSPPGTGDEHMTILNTIPDARSIVVTTPQEISLADVRKAINFLQSINSPILGIIENMSGLICPNCGTSIDLFKKGGGKELAEKYSLRFLGDIPLDPAAVIASDRGIPVVELDLETPAKQAFIKIAEEILNILS